MRILKSLRLINNNQYKYNNQQEVQNSINHKYNNIKCKLFNYNKNQKERFKRKT